MLIGNWFPAQIIYRCYIRVHVEGLLALGPLILLRISRGTERIADNLFSEEFLEINHEGAPHRVSILTSSSISKQFGEVHFPIFNVREIAPSVQLLAVDGGPRLSKGSWGGCRYRSRRHPRCNQRADKTFVGYFDAVSSCRDEVFFIVSTFTFGDETRCFPIADARKLGNVCDVTPFLRFQKLLIHRVC